jgi:Sulfatase-modifying factor enzyme 1
MRQRLRSHLTYANVMATLAVFIALGGTATAAVIITSNSQVAQNTISGHKPPSGKHSNLIAGSVNGTDVAGNSLTGSDINESALDATPLRTRVAQGGCQSAVPGTGAMVKVGATCIDRYEASVWSSPTGGTQYGVSSDDYPCSDRGQDCSNIYARSVPGVTPSRFITYFQAQQALANSGKRLATNAEWQAAVAGTPDSTACNVNSGSVANTGAKPGCVSRFGANDMVGNVWEWVADWMPRSTACGFWDPGFGSDDMQCIGGAATSGEPGALIRGGYFGGGASAGPFAVDASRQPSSTADFGFRGAR